MRLLKFLDAILNTTYPYYSNYRLLLPLLPLLPLLLPLFGMTTTIAIAPISTTSNHKRFVPFCTCP